LRVPRLRSCNALPTFLDAFLPYLAMALLVCKNNVRSDLRRKFQLPVSKGFYEMRETAAS
jgi:hypothetical protein